MTDRYRRALLQTLAAGATACVFTPGLRALQPAPPPLRADRSDFRAQAAAIRNRIGAPSFPDRDFDIRRYGAKGDGRTDDSAAIQAAIDACAAAGGGRLLVRQGVFVTGPIHLKSNINLHLAKNATLSFVTDPGRYLPPVFTRWEGVELMGYSPLIYAFEQHNIAITGKGTLKGNANAQTWWPWKGPWKHRQDWGADGAPTQREARTRLFDDAEKKVPVEQRRYAEGAYLRPPFIQPYRCRDVLIEGVTIADSPFWLINPVLCERVRVAGVTCRSHGPNSDGCNPESCRDVLIENCFFDTGDDCIAIKSGRNADGRRIATPSENILVSGCRMRAGHGGVVIGSEISGGARNILVEDCEMSSPDLERGIRIKTNSLRGGVIENFYIRNIEIGQVRDAIVINFYYEEGDAGSFDPVVRNIVIEEMYCRQAGRVFQLRGYPRSPIEGLTLRNVRVERAGELGVLENIAELTVEDLIINGEQYMHSPARAGLLRI